MFALDFSKSFYLCLSSSFLNRNLRSLVIKNLYFRKWLLGLNFLGYICMCFCMCLKLCFACILTKHQIIETLIVKNSIDCLSYKAGAQWLTCFQRTFFLKVSFRSNHVIHRMPFYSEVYRKSIDFQMERESPNPSLLLISCLIACMLFQPP